MKNLMAFIQGALFGLVVSTNKNFSLPVVIVLIVFNAILLGACVHMGSRE